MKKKRRFPFPADRLGLIVIPSFLRHVTPWWLLERIAGRYHVCWSGLVMWKLGYEWDWNVTPRCFEPYDYCGHYKTEAEQREALRNQPEEVLLRFKEKP